MASKLQILLNGLGIFFKGALNLNSTGEFPKYYNFDIPGDCAKVTQDVFLDSVIKKVSEKGFVLKNFCQIRKRMIYFFLIIFIIAGNVFAQENVLRFAWAPNTEPYLSHYIIYRDTEPGTMKMLDQIPKTDSTYTDNTVEARVTYYYKLTAVDSNGNESKPTPELIAFVGIITSNDAIIGNTIHNFELKQNYPNPFNPITTIDYTLSRNSVVTIIVYDLLGKEIRRLVDEFKVMGNYQTTWDGRNKYGDFVASGVYFYQMTVENYIFVKKLVFQK